MGLHHQNKIESLTMHQVSINQEDIARILQDVGFKLNDYGDHWRSNAAFRQGDNPTSIKIYKNSGVWFDYTVGSAPQPFDKLLSFFIPDRKQRMSILGSAKEISYQEPQKIQLSMETIYPESCLERLFPNFAFYEKKGISKETLNFYKAGVAHSGKMYKRMVFPIYNEQRKIIGFSGRKISDASDNSPKWKHLGKKRNWVYPAFIPNEDSIDAEIKNKKTVILVESIGDSLALFESGVKNNLVTFGLGCSASIINYLSSFEIERIILTPNNDFNSSKNHGYNASIKAVRSLSAYFNVSSLEIKLPPKNYNDLSEAFEQGEDLSKWTKEDFNAEWMNDARAYALNHKNQFNEKDFSFLKELKYYART